MTPWLAGPALLALAMTGYNLVVWPRGRPRRIHRGMVSVLIPARDEEDSIEAAVRAALAAAGPEDEVLVGDDGSTDATPDILTRLIGEDARLRVIHPPSLPAGWVGKPHNCHHLARAAKGETFLFVDADVTLAPDALDRLADLADRYTAPVISAFPAQETQTTAEAHLMPLLALTYTAWLPLPLVWATQDPRFLAANGQVLQVDASTYEDLGGFEAVRGEVVDDMAFCRRAKEHGARVVFADGKDVARCRMYGSGAELWKGFTKNLYEGLGESPLLLAAVMVLYLTAFVLPFVALALSPLWPALLPTALLGVGANLLTRGMLAFSRDHRPSSLLTHPFAVLALLALAMDSARRTRAGQVQWAGRVYARRAERGLP